MEKRRYKDFDYLDSWQKARKSPRRITLREDSRFAYKVCEVSVKRVQVASYIE